MHKTTVCERNIYHFVDNLVSQMQLLAIEDADLKRLLVFILHVTLAAWWRTSIRSIRPPWRRRERRDQGQEKSIEMLSSEGG